MGTGWIEISVSWWIERLIIKTLLNLGELKLMTWWMVNWNFNNRNYEFQPLKSVFLASTALRAALFTLNFLYKISRWTEIPTLIRLLPRFARQFYFSFSLYDLQVNRNSSSHLPGGVSTLMWVSVSHALTLDIFVETLHRRSLGPPRPAGVI